MHTGEMLVLLEDRTAGDTLDRLRGRSAWHTVASPRLVIVEGETDDAREAAPRLVPGVVSVAASEAGSELKEGLNAEEELFVDAWLRRRAQSAHKERPGEGMPWDAAGFSLPDPPPSEG